MHSNLKSYLAMETNSLVCFLMKYFALLEYQTQYLVWMHNMRGHCRVCHGRGRGSRKETPAGII